MKKFFSLLLISILSLNICTKAELVNPEIVNRYPAKLQTSILYTADSIAVHDLNAKSYSIIKTSIDSVYTIKSAADKNAINIMAQDMVKEEKRLKNIVEYDKYPKDSGAYYNARYNACRIICNDLRRLKSKDKIMGSIFTSVIDVESTEEYNNICKFLNPEMDKIKQHYNLSYMLDINFFVDKVLHVYYNIVCLNANSPVFNPEQSKTVTLSLTESGVISDHAYVDLGLPSGTLWATKNIGADTPEANGDYFAWGEVSPKTLYSASNYKWNDNDKNTVSKYSAISKTKLDTKDDAATTIWGKKWHTPSHAQQAELIKGCDWVWTNDGVTGFIGTSKTNGNKIFLPAAGFRTESLNKDVIQHNRVVYWSSNFDANGNAKTLSNLDAEQTKCCAFGCTIRAVSKK